MTLYIFKITKRNELPYLSMESDEVTEAKTSYKSTNFVKICENLTNE